MFNQSDNEAARKMFAGAKILAGLLRNCGETAKQQELGRIISQVLTSAYATALETDYEQCGKTAETDFWGWAWQSIEYTTEYQASLEVRNWFAAHAGDFCPEDSSVVSKSLRVDIENLKDMNLSEIINQFFSTKG